MIDHVSKHSKVDIKATDFNKILDMAEFEKNKLKKGKTVRKNNNAIVEVCNTTNEDLPMYAVVTLGALLFTPKDKQYFVGEELIFSIDKPTLQYSDSPTNSRFLDLGGYLNKVCILQQPLKKKEIGKGIIKGVAKVKIKKETNAAGTLTIVDTTKKMFLLQINNDAEKMFITNKETANPLLWHNFDFSLGVTQLNTGNFPEPFIGILDCIADTVTTFKLIIKDYYSGRVFHAFENNNFAYFRNLTMKPARPKSVSVIAKYYYTDPVTKLDYAEFRPFFGTHTEGIVKYDDLQTTLNSTVLGRRSYKDAIASWFNVNTDPAKRLIASYGEWSPP